MRLNKILVKNWRSIDKQGAVIQLGQITALTGSNNSGKTSLLLSSYATIDYFSLGKDPFVKDILLLSGNENIKNNPLEAEIELVTEESDITIILSLLNEDYLFVHYSLPEIFQLLSDESKMYILKFVKEIKVNINFNDEIFRSTYPCLVNNLRYSNFIKNDEELYLSFLEHIARGANELASFDWNTRVLDDLIDTFKYFVQTISCICVTNLRDYNPARYNTSYELTTEYISRPSLENDASDLPKYIEAIRSEHGRLTGKYERLLKYMRILFPEIEDIDVNRPISQFPEKDIFIKWSYQNHSTYQPLSRSGTGIANCLFIISKLLTYTSVYPKIVFVDEPEAGFHPRLQSQLIKLLRTLSIDFNVQWVLATHSPFLLKKFNKSDVINHVDYDGKRAFTTQYPVDSMNDVLHSLGAFLPETLVAKGIILVEGATEALILPVLLEQVGLDIDEEGILIIPMGGENLYDLDLYSFKKIHDNILIIIDSDLQKPPSKGGSISQKKLDLKHESQKCNISFYMCEDFRTIENMYPNHILSSLLGKEYEPYDQIDLGSKKKKEFALEVAKQMSCEEIGTFPLVQAVFNWWRGILPKV